MQWVRRVVPMPQGPDITDGQLLERFIRGRDAAAFEALVQWHGPMVLGVCRRLLRNEHDAEDAFQATFLVLVHKAASIVPREMVGNWLYGVAYRTALRAKSTAAKRRTIEKQVATMPEPEIAQADESWRLLQPLLDQELSRLPDKYRVPIVLCHLEGKTQKEAARLLAWPEGTVAVRLMRARAMLAKRLARCGLPLSAGLLALALVQNPMSAGVPAPLVAGTVKTATFVAAGQAVASGTIAPEVTALTKGVLTAMFLTKLNTALGVGALVLVLAGLGWWGAQPGKAPSFINRSVGQESFAEVDEEGFYFQEYNGDQPYRWTNGHGRLGIPINPTNPPEALLVQLAAYRGPGTSKARLEIVVNNHTVFQDDIPPGYWARRVDLQGISLGEQVGVELISDTYCPLGNPRGDGPGISDDTRTLGVLVWGITLVGKEKTSSAVPGNASADAEAVTVPSQESKPGGKEVSGAKEAAKLNALSLDGPADKVVWCKDGKLLATTSFTHHKDGDFYYETTTVRVWDVQKGEVKTNLRAVPKERIGSLAFSPDGTLLAMTVQSDGKSSEVRLIDVANRTVMRAIPFDGILVGVTFSPDGKRLVFGGPHVGPEGGKSVINFVDITKGEVVKKIEWPSFVEENGKLIQRGMTALGLSPNGKLLAAPEANHKLKIWDVESGNLKHDLMHGSYIHTLAFAPDGKTLVTDSLDPDRSVRLWDVEKGEQRMTFEGTKGPIRGVAVSADGKTVAASFLTRDKDANEYAPSRGGGEVVLWHAESGKLQQTYPLPGAVGGIAFAPTDGRELAIGVGLIKDGKAVGEVRFLLIGKAAAGQK